MQNMESFCAKSNVDLPATVIEARARIAEEIKSIVRFSELEKSLNTKTDFIVHVNLRTEGLGAQLEALDGMIVNFESQLLMSSTQLEESTKLMDENDRTVAAL